MSVQNLETIAGTASSQLEMHGWAHMQTDIDPQDRDTVRGLFRVMNNKLAIDATSNPEISVIAPRDNSRVLATSHEAMSFHTDNVYLDDPCRTVALFCAVQAEDGGDNELVDALSAIRGMPNDALEQLMEPQWRWVNPATDTLSPEYPVVDQSLEAIRWWRMGVVARDVSALAIADAFEDILLDSAGKVHVRMQPGDLLVTNNTRIVHSRKAFSGKRHVYRARFW